MNKVLLSHSFYLIALLFLAAEIIVLGFQLNIWSQFSPNYVSRSSPVAASPQLELYGMDWFAPVVKVKSANKLTTFQTTDFIVESDSLIFPISLPQGWRLNYVNEGNGKFFYILASAKLEKGKNKYPLSIADLAGNLVHLEISVDAGKSSTLVLSWKGSNYVLPIGETLVRVDKSYRLPEDFHPTDLIYLSSLKINNTNNARIRKIAVKDLKAMTNAISKAGINYNISSGYRSYSDQVRTYNFWLGYNNGSTQAADTISARPGHSEHQLGVTLDFTTAENGSIFHGFETTKLARWLRQNAYKYGFTMSYPKGKEEITGYSFEPWHFRYVGKEVAQMLWNKNLSLTEYLISQDEK